MSLHLVGKLLDLWDFFLHNGYSRNTIILRGTSFTMKVGNEYGQTKLVYYFWSDTSRHNCATLCLFTYNSKTILLIYLNLGSWIDQMILNNFVSRKNYRSYPVFSQLTGLDPQVMQNVQILEKFNFIQLFWQNYK